ncbi:Molybdenum-containing formylmethanofuran dehydrogenase 1 subunit C [uncultured archaeon]|nr:Molybdenum-containing formylmethanofuran dehydrogenase 1 subunit C [uncultured archaeon]
MSLKRFMEDAYQGRARAKRLETRRGIMVFSLEDLADRIGTRPTRAEVEALAPADESLLGQLIAADPGKKYQILWGILSSIAAERSPVPVQLPARDFAGLELCRGSIIVEEAKDNVGERMRGGRILICGAAGDFLGQEMSGGGIVAGACKDYAFRKMRGGFGVVRGFSGNYTGVGNSGGRIVVRGSCGERAGWLMRGGSVRIAQDAGDYLGLLMSGGRITVKGRTGRRAGWRRRGGAIRAGGYGPEAGDGVLGLD